MVQILQPKQKESFSSQLGLALGSGLGSGIGSGVQQHYQRKFEAEAAKAKEESDMRRLEREYALRGELDEKKFSHEKDIKSQELDTKIIENYHKLDKERKEKLSPFISGLQTIETMREISNRENIGRGSSVFGYFGGETAKDIGQYQTLGNSLISLASTIPIRNKAEFEKLAGELGDPSLPKERREGVLNAMEQIIKQNMHQYLTGEEMGQYNQEPFHLGISQPKQKRKPLTAFE